MEQSPKKELLFSGSAGASSFQIGYARALVEIIGKEKLKEYHFGGVSAGSAVAGYTLLSLYSDVDLKTSYQNCVRRFFEKENRKYYGLFTNGKLIYNLANDFWEQYNKLQLPNLHEKYHLYYTTIEGYSFKANLIEEFKNQEHFAHSLEASCTLPMITTFGFYKNYQGKKAIDGGFSKPIPYRFEDSKKVFINVLPKSFCFGNSSVKNLKILNISENCDISFPYDYYVWDEHWADEMFLRGYLQGLQDKEKIMAAFADH